MWIPRNRDTVGRCRNLARQKFGGVGIGVGRVIIQGGIKIVWMSGNFESPQRCSEQVILVKAF